MDPMLHDTILGLEDQTWKALTHSGAALLPFLSRDCIMLFPMGMKVSAKTSPNLDDVMMSEAFIPWRRYKLSDVEVTPLGTEAAAITYRVVATRQLVTEDDDNDNDSDDDDGDDEPQDEFRALVSSTWRKDPEAGKWLLCIQQQTPYPNDIDD
ncbi:hypothetical protein A1O3_05590 [Capronia epimyces CBS 606.96]|uniref:Uncharacterized protein n=1 Tax=Capronia epimyces CBS 606.96 TaxID=1182542 RepID=W9Y5M5_9EURO|nr:uncharacterized protein A1O3_05590 [Capronia epimyces CBS 606.96]EXJ84915.1 hypothetical protein A1O3_05590 [Capronia epimyces CBS 606.96]